MGQDLCVSVMASGAENLAELCGRPATWRTDNGTLLCDTHRLTVQDQQPTRGFEPIDSDA